MTALWDTRISTCISNTIIISSLGSICSYGENNVVFAQNEPDSQCKPGIIVRLLLSFPLEQADKTVDSHALSFGSHPTRRWQAFVDSAKLERHEAATRLQALARAKEAKKKTAELRRQCWANAMIGRQVRKDPGIQNVCPHRPVQVLVLHRGFGEPIVSGHYLHSWQVSAPQRSG